MRVKFHRIIGTGGIGVGLLFESGTNETLGRNESRLAHLSAAKDYCKQHIVLHYTATLIADLVPVHPVGLVGKDSYGMPLIEEMKSAGMTMDHVYLHPYLPTTVSFCLQYPDKDGCNITASNGASDGVTSELILQSLKEIGVDRQTLLAAIPEVRPETRMKMLAYGREQGSFNVISIPEAEAAYFKQSNVFAYCDLLAINQLEAAALHAGTDNNCSLVDGLYREMIKINRDACLLVTCGKEGAYAAQSGRIEFIPPIPVIPVNTTGAGDAFLGGLLAGLAYGLPLTKGRGDAFFGATELESAAEFGAICAGMSVESVDTIAQHVNRLNIQEWIRQNSWRASSLLTGLLKGS